MESCESRLGSKGLSLELGQLVKLGFLTALTKRGKRYYMANERFSGYRELRDSTVKAARSYEDELTRFLKKLGHVDFVALTGLFMGNAAAECDVVLVGTPSRAQVAKFAAGVEKLMGQEVNYAIFPPEEFRYRSNTFDRFIKDVFENRHLVVVDKIH